MGSSDAPSNEPQELRRGEPGAGRVGRRTPGHGHGGRTRLPARTRPPPEHRAGPRRRSRPRRAGCYGQTTIRTPHIDRLAEEGIRFTRFYAGAATCAPSRAALLTGMHAGHGRVRNNPPGGGMDLPFEPEDTTIAQVFQVFQEAGYRTGLFGKWGFCPEDGAHPSHPNAKGFEEFFGQLTHQHAQAYYSPYQWADGERVPVEGNADDATRDVRPRPVPRARPGLRRTPPGRAVLPDGRRAVAAPPAGSPGA